MLISSVPAHIYVPTHMLAHIPKKKEEEERRMRRKWRRRRGHFQLRHLTPHIHLYLRD